VAFAFVVEQLNKQLQLRRETNPVVMTAPDFRTKHQGGDRFVTRMMGVPKLFLFGDANELGELVEDRPAEEASTARASDRSPARRRERKSVRRP
jgi:hypothetical protein